MTQYLRSKSLSNKGLQAKMWPNLKQLELEAIYPPSEALLYFSHFTLLEELSLTIERKTHGFYIRALFAFCKNLKAVQINASNLSFPQPSVSVDVNGIKLPETIELKALQTLRLEVA